MSCTCGHPGLGCGCPAPPMPKPKFDAINKARHYNSHPSGVEAIEICRHLSGDWFNVFKYVYRADHKNGKQDIEKSIYYIEDSRSHNLPMHGRSWRYAQQQLLDRVIAAETDRNRIGFFIAVKSANQTAGLEWVRKILAGYDR